MLTGLAFGVSAAIDEGRAVADSFSELGDDGHATLDLDAEDEVTVMAYWNDGRPTEDIDRPAATVSIVGINLGTFTAKEAGEHQVRVRLPVSGDPPRAATGRLDVMQVVGSVLRPIGYGAAAAVILWIVLLVLRSSSKRRQREQPQSVTSTPSTGSKRTGPFV